MEMLKFLGRGCSFLPKEGNTSAYYKIDNRLLLIDCGELVFSKIMDINLLDNIKEVNILITHMHSDHIGSLSNLIYYLYYIKNIIPTITYPIKDEIVDFLLKQGAIVDFHYKLNTATLNIMDMTIEANPTSHYEVFKDVLTDVVISNPINTIFTVKNVFNSFGYYIRTSNKTIYYSGDSNELSIDLSKVDIVYQDCSVVEKEDFPHLTFNKLLKIVKPEDRHKIHLMHIDSYDIFAMANKYGFNVVSLDEVPSIYVLSTISINKKTEQDLIKEWKIRNIRYDKTAVSYEHYIEFLNSWNDDIFDYSVEENCYFKTFEDANYCATKNIGDLNDGGIYDYVVVYKTALNKVYAMTNIREAYLYKFNYDNKTYEPVDFTDSEEGKFLINKLCIDYLY